MITFATVLLAIIISIIILFKAERLLVLIATLKVVVALPNIKLLILTMS